MGLKWVECFVQTFRSGNNKSEYGARAPVFLLIDAPQPLQSPTAPFRPDNYAHGVEILISYYPNTCLCQDQAKHLRHVNIYISISIHPRR